MIRWKKARLGEPSPRLAIITPSWLSVDRAIIFFKSHSAKAAIPAINIVIEAKISSKGQNILFKESKLKNRISRNTPAVTKVEE